jgi:hypothetical protein
MNDTGIIRWPLELSAAEHDASGVADLEALAEHLAAAETLLWKAADATSSMVTLQYLSEAVDVIEDAWDTSFGTDFYNETTRLFDKICTWATPDHWCVPIHEAIADIAALLADVRGRHE